MKANQSIEVTKEQYELLKEELSGIVAFREEGGKYYVKVMIAKYVKLVKQILKIN